MSNDIKWLSDFAENYGKKIKRTAAKKGEQIILDRERLAGAKVGDKVKLNGKMYRIADVDFEDEKGPGIAADEIMGYEGTESDPIGMEMGTAHVPSSSACTVAPERAYTDPGNIFDLDVQAAEQSKFEGEASTTESKIQQEQNIDRTQRSTPINLPSSDTSDFGPGAELPVATEPEVEEDYEVADDLDVEPASEPVEESIEDLDLSNDDGEVADDLDVETDDFDDESEDEISEEDLSDEEDDDEEEMDEDEIELNRMSSLANNRILKRMLTANRR